MSEILTDQVGPEKQFYDFLSDGEIKSDTINKNKEKLSLLRLSFATPLAKRCSFADNGLCIVLVMLGPLHRINFMKVSRY